MINERIKNAGNTAAKIAFILTLVDISFVNELANIVSIVTFTTVKMKGFRDRIFSFPEWMNKINLFLAVAFTCLEKLDSILAFLNLSISL